MRFKFNGEEWSIHFEHSRYPYCERKARTTCIIRSDFKGYFGTAECSWKDQFSKAKGRELSLQRALDTCWSNEGFIQTAKAAYEARKAISPESTAKAEKAKKIKKLRRELDEAIERLGL